MVSIQKIFRSSALIAIMVGATGCCCCDPGGLVSEFAGEKFSQSLNEQVAKAQEQAQQLEQSAEKMKQAADELPAQLDDLKEQAEAAKAAAAEVKAKQAAADPAKNVSKNGEFQSDPIQKTNLTSGRIKLQFTGSNVTGTFIGQYHVRPYSLKLEGKIDPSGAFEVASASGDNDIKIAGTNDGTKIAGTIKGLLRGKAIDAKFTGKKKD